MLPPTSRVPPSRLTAGGPQSRSTGAACSAFHLTLDTKAVKLSHNETSCFIVKRRIVQLQPECHLVASGYLGFGLTSDWDCHAYLLLSGSEAVLIDSGSGRQSDAVAERIDNALDGRRLVAIALTHSHVDHSGGAAALSERYDAPVYVHPTALEALVSGDEEFVGLPGAREAGVYAPDQSLMPVPRAIAVGRSILVGDLELRAHPTPGHSVDHVVYAAELTHGLAMFSGDLVFAQGRVAILDTPDTDRRSYEESIRTMNALRPDYLFPGHGAVSLARGGAHIAAAVAAFDRGVEPAGLLA
jgi:hydroxyacylglutathione hydrolase